MNDRPKRKAIPARVKTQVLSRQHSLCAGCAEALGADTEYDHRPALILRPVNAAGTDYEPAQNNPDFIDAMHPPCHLRRTTGRQPGAERTVTTKGSDAWLKAKFNRLEGRTKQRPKAKIRSRGFPQTKRTFRNG